MSHIGYFITIEGVENIPATEAFTGAGSWNGRTFLSAFEKSGMSSFEYSIDPHKREADVGVMSISLVDKHGATDDSAAGVLTELFAIRKSQPRLYLKDTIEQGDTMSGAGTVEVTGSVSGIDFPTYFHIERETFYSAQQGAEKVFGQVSRARYGSRADRHIGYRNDEGYNPEVRIAVPSWKDRMCHIYRVVDDDVTNATRWWSGPILDLTPSGVNTWTLKIGSVIRLLETTIFDVPSLKLTRDIDKPELVSHYDDEDGFNVMTNQYTIGAVRSLPMEVNGEIVRSGIATSSASTVDADGIRAYTYSTTLNEPDGHWNSQHAMRMETGANGPTFRLPSTPRRQLLFIEAASPSTILAGTFAAGSYDTDTLAAQVSSIMTDATGNAYTYVCSLNGSSGKFQIAESGGNNFTLKFATYYPEVSQMLGYAYADTSAASIHIAGNEFLAKTQGLGVPLYDWDNGSNKLTHTYIGSSNLPASGDKFRIERWNKYPPNNVYDCFPAMIEDELVAAFPVVPKLGAFSMVRGIEKTTAEAWGEGTPVVEVLSNYRMDSDFFGIAEHTDYDKYRAETIGGIKATKRNPLKWFLELWHSTGGGWNGTAATTLTAAGTWDVLHKEHGAALSSSLIASTTIAAVAEKIPTYRLGYKGPVSLKDILIRDICIPCGLYPGIDGNGKLTVKRLEQHDSDSTPDVTITESSIIKGSSGSTQDHVGIVGRIQIEHGWNPFNGEFQEVFDSGLTDIEYWYPESKPEKHKANIWPMGAEPDSTISSVRSKVLGAHATRILTRTGYPKVMLSLSAPLKTDTLPARPGDLAKVTLTGPCPLPTNTRTLTNEWFEVHKAAIDPNGSTVRFDLFWLGWYRDKFSKWNVSAKVTAWNAGTKELTIDTGLFKTNEDATDYVTAADKLQMYNIAIARKSGGTYGDTEEVTVASVAATTITLTGAPTNAPVANDVVSCCGYNSATTEQKKRAFLAEDTDTSITGDETVGTSEDNPYVYG